MRVLAQSGNVNGGWAQFHAGYISNLVTDWSSIKLEINKHGIFVNGSSIADLCDSVEVYTAILNNLTSASILQIGKKITAQAAHPAVFKRVSLCKLENTLTEA